MEQSVSCTDCGHLHEGLCVYKGFCDLKYSGWKPKDRQDTEDFEAHYSGTIQPLEYMQAQMSQEEFRGFLKGNIIKYVSRCGKKDDPVKEMTKVLRYADWLKDSYEGKIVDPRK